MSVSRQLGLVAAWAAFPIAAGSWAAFAGPCTAEQRSAPSTTAAQPLGQPAQIGQSATTGRPSFQLPPIYAALDLTDEQRAAVEQAFRSAAQQMSTIYADHALKPEERDARLRTIVAARRKQLDQILTPDQKEELPRLQDAQSRAQIPAMKLMLLTRQLKLTRGEQQRVAPIIQWEIDETEQIRGTSTVLSKDQRDQIERIHQTALYRIKTILTPQQARKMDDSQPAGTGDAGATGTTQPGAPPAPSTTSGPTTAPR